MIQEPIGPIEEKKKKTSFKGRNILYVFLSLLLLFVIFYFLPPFKTVETPYDDLERPLVIAHQGGEHLAPSNTLTAFKQAMELGVDVIELDIHMTKDGHLVAIHDDTVDRTTDGTGRVNDLTLEEIKKLDAGYYFEDEKGEHPFRGQGIEIPTVEEIFEAIPNMTWNIEIKDTNDPELYDEIVQRFWQILQDYGLEKNVLIASFNHDIIKKVQEVSEGEAFVSGGRGEITKFVILQKLFLRNFYAPSVNAIQIPTSESGIPLTSKGLIKTAQRFGMDVHYWTINDEVMMKELIDKGADGIITDRPDLMLNLLNR